MIVPIAPDNGSTSTRIDHPDPSYWTDDRMRSAIPAPMPSG